MLMDFLILAILAIKMGTFKSLEAFLNRDVGLFSCILVWKGYVISFYENVALRRGENVARGFCCRASWVEYEGFYKEIEWGLHPHKLVVVAGVVDLLVVVGSWLARLENGFDGRLSLWTYSNEGISSR